MIFEVKMKLSVAVRKRLMLVLILNLIIAGIGAILLYTKELNIWDVKCQVKELTGLSCPGCGMTRLVLALADGNYYQAFRYNPFFFVTLPVLILVYLWECIVYVKEQMLSLWLDKFLIGYAVCEIVFGLVRNLEMFRYLLPTTL
jgi:hypothetical protein